MYINTLIKKIHLKELSYNGITNKNNKGQLLESNKLCIKILGNVITLNCRYSRNLIQENLKKYVHFSITAKSKKLKIFNIDVG